MADLATLTQLKLYLGITGSAVDGILQQLLTAYSQAARSYCNRDFTQGTYTELIDGPDSKRLALANSPVVSVQSLSILDTLGNATAVDVSQLRVKTGGLGSIVSWPGGWFPCGEANISISYTAGFATIPTDLAEAVVESAALRYKELDRIGFNSKSLAGETVSFNVKAWPDSAKMILNQYRRGFFA